MKHCIYTMEEETKEEYLARHRRELGLTESPEKIYEEKEPVKFITKLKNLMFYVLVLLFVWAVYNIFGMMNSN